MWSLQSVPLVKAIRAIKFQPPIVKAVSARSPGGASLDVAQFGGVSWPSHSRAPAQIDWVGLL
jgi:hypothetical protein